MHGATQMNTTGKTQVRITTKNGVRAAFYRPTNCTMWFRLPVAQAERALREGKISVGISTNVPCVEG